jgi:hypothetical protein
VNERPTAAAPSRGSAACCATPDVETQRDCGLCGRPLCRRCGGRVNGRPVCGECLAQIQSELDAEAASTEHVPGGILGGVAGTLVGGAIWAGVAIATKLAIGYVAVLVGFLAGYGTFLGAGKRKGKPLQIVAVACALLGLLLGKYLIVAHEIIHLPDLADQNLSYTDTRIFKIFFENISEFFRLFDLLWIFLALGAAMRATQPTLTRTRPMQSRG